MLKCVCRAKVSPPGQNSITHQSAASSAPTVDSATLDETRNGEENAAVLNQDAARHAPADPAGQAADAVEAMEIDMASESAVIGASQLDQQPTESGQQIPGAKQHLGNDIRSSAAAAHVRQRRRHAGRPTSIPFAPKLPCRKHIPRSLEFDSAASIKAVLVNAWSRDADAGIQAAVLFELFGDSILPYVPMLPLMSHRT